MKSKGAGNLWAVFALVFSIVAISGAAFVAYQNHYQILPNIQSGHVQQDTDRALIEALTISNEHLRQQLESLTASLQQLEQDSKSSDSEHGQQITEILDSVSVLYQDQGKDIENWKLEEIVYLLLMGNQRLTLTHDLDAALLVWNVVDQQLKQYGDPNVLSVRRVVSEEMILLRQLEPIDITQISLDLLALSNTVTTLPLRVISIRSEQESEKNASSEDDLAATEVEQNWFESALSEAADDLRNLVRVRRIDSEETPILLPEKQYFLMENARLGLYVAHVAALRNEGKIYRENLANVERLIQQFFDKDARSVQNFLTRLEQLLNTEVELVLPNVSGSLELLQQVVSENSSG